MLPLLCHLELIVQGSWNCEIQTLSCAKGKRTSDVKTPAWGWCFECTSTSPTAGLCPCRRPPTPSSAVSRTSTGQLACSFLLASAQAEGGIYCCNPINSATILLPAGANPVPLHSISFVWSKQFAKAIDALYMMPDTRVIYLNSHFMTECTSYCGKTTPLAQVPQRSFASPSFGMDEWTHWKRALFLCYSWYIGVMLFAPEEAN